MCLACLNLVTELELNQAEWNHTKSVVLTCDIHFWAWATDWAMITVECNTFQFIKLKPFHVNGHNMEFYFTLMCFALVGHCNWLQVPPADIELASLCTLCNKCKVLSPSLYASTSQTAVLSCGRKLAKINASHTHTVQGIFITLGI